MDDEIATLRQEVRDLTISFARHDEQIKSLQGLRSSVDRLKMNDAKFAGWLTLAAVAGGLIAWVARNVLDRLP